MVSEHHRTEDISPSGSGILPPSKTATCEHDLTIITKSAAIAFLVSFQMFLTPGGIDDIKTAASPSNGGAASVSSKGTVVTSLQAN